MSREELQRQSLEAAVGDVGVARVQFDDDAGWLAAAGASPADPLGVEVWVFNADLTQVLLVLHPWRGWVPPGGTFVTTTGLSFCTHKVFSAAACGHHWRTPTRMTGLLTTCNYDLPSPSPPRPPPPPPTRCQLRACRHTAEYSDNS